MRVFQHAAISGSPGEETLPWSLCVKRAVSRAPSRLYKRSHWTDHGDVDFDSVVRRWAGPPGRSASSVP